MAHQALADLDVILAKRAQFSNADEFRRRSSDTPGRVNRQIHPGSSGAVDHA